MCEGLPGRHLPPHAGKLTRETDDVGAEHLGPLLFFPPPVEDAAKSTCG